MPEKNVKKKVLSAVESRKSARKLKELVNQHGKEAVYSALNHLLGDLPDGTLVRKIAMALNLPEADLRSMAESSQEDERRLSRLILLESKTGISEDPLLQKGLSDKAPLIRSDAARFTGSGSDRTRLYNQLVKLIREDPDMRVRRTAGKRLADSFADLYSIELSGLPPLSQMLIIDALEGHSRVDEERVETLLYSDDAETSFRAARTLERWGTLKDLLEGNTREENEENSEKNLDILKRSASLGVSRFLENISLHSDKVSLAIELADLARREDLVRIFTVEKEGNENGKKEEMTIFPNLSETLLSLSEEPEGKVTEKIRELPLDNSEFKNQVESTFPIPERDISARILYAMAAAGAWKDWEPRLLKGLKTGIPEIAVSAMEALAEISPSSALEALPPFLEDPCEQVREAAARILSSRVSGEGIKILGEFLKTEPGESGYIKAVLSGIREAGGAAIARCIIDNFRDIGAEIAGELLSEGIDKVGVEILADEFTDTNNLKNLLKHSGYHGGLSLLSAWPVIKEKPRQTFLQTLIDINWAESIPLPPSLQVTEALKNLGSEEKKTLLEPVLQTAGGRDRRQIRKLMKN